MTRKTRTPQIIALAALYGFVFLAFSLLCPVSANAQTRTLPQSVTAQLATSGTACTGISQNFVTGSVSQFDNLGQTQHYIYAAGDSNVTSMSVAIFGEDEFGNDFQISDTSTSQATAVLVATGTFPKIKVSVLCYPASVGTFSLDYVGTSATPNIIAGSYLSAQIDKSISRGLSAGSNFATSIYTPFGDSFGVLYFSYVGGSGPSGSTISVSCQGGTIANTAIYSFVPASSTGIQTFIVPDGPCVTANVGYNAGGANSNTWKLDYFLTPAGFKLTSGYTHLASTTATVIKSGAGVVQSVAINTAAAGTITLFDLVPASCTGTPSTNVVSIIDGSNATPRNYGTLFQNGICVKASSGSIDFTVVSQ
jgi:hypothetical protein